jgi:hypothetical protein
MEEIIKVAKAMLEFQAKRIGWEIVGDEIETLGLEDDDTLYSIYFKVNAWARVIIVNYM